MNVLYLYDVESILVELESDEACRAVTPTPLHMCTCKQSPTAISQSIGERAFFERRSERRSQSMNVSVNAFILCGRERELELVPTFP